MNAKEAVAALQTAVEAVPKEGWAECTIYNGFFA